MKIEHNLLISVDNTDIINGHFKVPDNVNAIEKNCFHGMVDLQTVDLSNTRILRESVFSDCTHLREVLNGDLTWIDNYVFENCINLKHIKLNKVKVLGVGMFKNCFLLPFINKEVKKEIYESVKKLIRCRLQYGLCEIIDETIISYTYRYRIPICRETLFPLYRLEIATKYFKASVDDAGYWWPIDNRKIRLEFLKFCYEKNDMDLL